MNNIYTIFRKEMARFFKDKRMVVSVVILPGLMIYLMYSMIGGFISKEMKEADTYKPKAYVNELPKSMEAAFQSLNMEILKPEGKEFEKERREVKEKNADFLIIFPENFDEAVKNYEVQSGGLAPQIELYFNSSRSESGMAYNMVSSILEKYEESLSNKFDVNAGGEEKYDLATKEDVAGKVFGGMLPMLLMIFMWSGCLAIAPESISGEKERGTIATLLITPIKRRDIALGKISALSVIALLSGASSFVGTFTSLPKMFQGMGGVSANSYGADELAMLFVVILSTVVLLVTIVSIISAFAKTVKEAATLASPAMIVVMVISILPMFFAKEEAPIFMYFIPLYNSVLSMNNIFKFSYHSLSVVLTVITNLISSGILVMVLTKMFHSEKIMLSK